MKPDDVGPFSRARHSRAAGKKRRQPSPAARLVFEGVPEIVDLKREVLGEASRLVGLPT